MIKIRKKIRINKKSNKKIRKNKKKNEKIIIYYQITL